MNSLPGRHPSRKSTKGNGRVGKSVARGTFLTVRSGWSTSMTTRSLFFVTFPLLRSTDERRVQSPVHTRLADQQCIRDRSVSSRCGRRVRAWKGKAKRCSLRLTAGLPDLRSTSPIQQKRIRRDAVRGRKAHSRLHHSSVNSGRTYHQTHSHQLRLRGKRRGGREEDSEVCTTCE